MKSLLLDLEKGGTRPVLELLQSDAVINTVEYIRVEYWGDGNILVSDEELITIFGIIGSLPRIRELRIEFDELPLPAQALRNALGCPNSRLSYLALEDVRLSGTIDDFKDVARAVRSSRALKTVRMLRCGPAHDSRAKLDPIIVALASVPTLKDITLSSTHVDDETLGKLGESKSLEVVSLDHMSICGGIPLGQLCRSSTIKDLKFWGMPEINDDVTFMTSALATNQSLKMLRIRYCNLQQESGIQLSKMIRINSNLESISLENMTWKDFGLPLCKSLETNKTLRSLSLSIDGKDINAKEDAVQVTKGLEQNTSLRKFRLILRDIDGDVVREAFAEPVMQLLQKNFTLESIYLNSSSWSLGREVEFFLALNRTRKRHLLRNENATKGEYMNMLAAHSEDLSITHYVLKMNPSLFQV